VGSDDVGPSDVELLAELAAFVRAIQERRDASPGLAEARGALALAHAAIRSAREGRPAAPDR